MIVLLAILLVVALFIAVPLLVIWALNTLFVLGIDYNFWTWLAVIIICTVLRAPTNNTGD